jgi:AcrR family transcriptional regulator
VDFGVTVFVDQMGTDKAHSRERLLEIARGQFLKNSYHGATLRSIASEAGVTTGSLYHHFSGKDELFVEVCAEGMKRMLSRLRAAAELTEGADAAERVVAVFDAYVAFFLEERGYFELLARLQGSPRELRIDDRLASRIDKLIARFVEDLGVLLGDVRPDLPTGEKHKRVLLAVALAEGLVACERRGLFSKFGLSLDAFRGGIRKIAVQIVSD